MGYYFHLLSVHEFPTKVIATVRDDQRSVREFYFNSIKKAELRNVNVVLMDFDEIDNPKQGQNPEQGNDVEMVDAFEEYALFEV